MPSRPVLPQLVWPLSDRGLSQRFMDLASLAFVTGDEPHARQAFFGDVDAIDALVPAEGELERELVQDGGDRQLLIRGDGWHVHLVLVRRRPEVQVLVTASTAERADALVAEIRQAVPPPERPEAQSRLTMWTAGVGGSPVRHRRWVDAPRWAAIQRNYPSDVQEALGRLMGMTSAPAAGGRLVLWYGVPGTGKTTAIRALSHEWRAWADVHFVLDPEAFFGGPDYLMHVVAEDDAWELRPAGNAGGRWKVLVVEDADELIRADARREAGASLGRLLNLTDGILGHGLRVLLLITTNEPMRGLHPAVVRPGRCLADVQFRSFSHGEAVDWLEGRGHGAGENVTLAELYRARGDLETIANERRPDSVGNYL